MVKDFVKEKECCYNVLICMLVSVHCCAANIYKSLKENAIVFSALWIKWQGNWGAHTEAWCIIPFHGVCQPSAHTPV